MYISKCIHILYPGCIHFQPPTSGLDPGAPGRRVLHGGRQEQRQPLRAPRRGRCRAAKRARKVGFHQGKLGKIGGKMRGK